jgi:hypothetical protein
VYLFLDGDGDAVERAERRSVAMTLTRGFRRVEGAFTIVRK